MNWADRFGLWLAGVVRRRRMAYRARKVRRARLWWGFSPALPDAEIERAIFGSVLDEGKK